MFTGQLGTQDSQLGWIVLGHGPASSAASGGAAARLVVGDRPSGAAVSTFPLWASSRPRSVYDLDDLVDLVAYFTDPATGDAVEPETVTLQILRPSGVEIAVDPVLDVATGFYVSELNIDEPGLWSYRFAGSGDWQAAQERGLWVRSGAFD